MKDWVKLITCSVLGGFVGGVVVWLVQGNTFYLMPQSMSYSDLVAVLLTAVSLIVAIFGVVMAILAIWGYRNFKNVVRNASLTRAEEVVKTMVTEDLRSGGARAMIEARVADFLDNGIREGLFAQWAEDRRRELERMNDLDNEG